MRPPKAGEWRTYCGVALNAGKGLGELKLNATSNHQPLEVSEHKCDML